MPLPCCRDGKDEAGREESLPERIICAGECSPAIDTIWVLDFSEPFSSRFSESGLNEAIFGRNTYIWQAIAPSGPVLENPIYGGNNKMAQKVQFVETVLRDANQSLIATRLPYDKFAPMLETIDNAGYYAIECWGGATFDVCLRYLNEDPWERLRKIRAAAPKTKLQMLLRGQNVLGYSHYPDDFVKMFVQKAVENGIDIIRIFDALNDTNNLKVAMEATVKAGAIASGTLSYTTSPVHTHKKYVEMVNELKAMGASTICIKDMAGIMGPQEAYDLVSAIKDAHPDMPIDLHTHSTTGLAFMTYLKAVEAGVDIIDTAIFLRRHQPARHRDPGLRSASAGLRSGPGRQVHQEDGRLLQGRSRRVHQGRRPDAQVHGYRHPVPDLPDPRRYALQPPEPAQAGQRSGPL